MMVETELKGLVKILIKVLMMLDKKKIIIVKVMLIATANIPLMKK